MGEFGEAAEGALSLIIGGVVMVVFGSTVTTEYLNITLIGLLSTVLGIVALVSVVAIVIASTLSR